MVKRYFVTIKKLQRNLLSIALLCTVFLTFVGLLALRSDQPKGSAPLLAAQAAQQSPLSAAQQSPLPSPADTSNVISITSPLTTTPAITTSTGVTTASAFSATAEMTLTENITAAVTFSTTVVQDEVADQGPPGLTATLVLTDIDSSVASPLPTPDVVSPTHIVEITATSPLTVPGEVDTVPSISSIIEGSEPLTTDANLPESLLATPVAAEPPSTPPSVSEDPAISVPQFFAWLQTIDITALVTWGQTLYSTGQLSLLLVGLLFAALFTMMGIVFLRH